MFSSLRTQMGCLSATILLILWLPLLGVGFTNHARAQAVVNCKNSGAENDWVLGLQDARQAPAWPSGGRQP
jgi:hypothetical protein